MNKTLLIVISFIAMVAIAIAGYVVLQNNRTSNVMSQEPETINEPNGAAGIELSQEPSNARVITIDASEFKFSEPTITITAGEVVKIVVNNTGEMKHDWVVEGEGIATDTIESGKSGTVEFAINTPGEYDTSCSVGDHKSRGMVGKLIVQ